MTKTEDTPSPHIEIPERKLTHPELAELGRQILRKNGGHTKHPRE